MPDKVGRNPKAETRDRRFQDKVRSILNALLRRGFLIRDAGLNDWKPNITVADLPDGLITEDDLADALDDLAESGVITLATSLISMEQRFRILLKYLVDLGLGMPPELEYDYQRAHEESALPPQSLTEE